MPSITLSGLAYAPPGGKTLFAGLALVFNRERIGLVGRNGVGKSRLLPFIEGQTTPSTGGITVDDTLGAMRRDRRQPVWNPLTRWLCCAAPRREGRGHRRGPLLRRLDSR
ncbi:ATP-binding cassette domain-containing protein [Martelella soudanensis]|uniref:ATP-binding cassette domain-containing protein n=1 Tax=unclassified Martelella TaxID=2629616 RepID=UPI0015DE5524